MFANLARSHTYTVAVAMVLAVRIPKSHIRIIATHFWISVKFGNRLRHTLCIYGGNLNENISIVFAKRIQWTGYNLKIGEHSYHCRAEMKWEIYSINTTYFMTIWIEKRARLLHLNLYKQYRVINSIVCIEFGRGILIVFCCFPPMTKIGFWTKVSFHWNAHIIRYYAFLVGMGIIASEL